MKKLLHFFTFLSLFLFIFLFTSSVVSAASGEMVPVGRINNTNVVAGVEWFGAGATGDKTCKHKCYGGWVRVHTCLISVETTSSVASVIIKNAGHGNRTYAFNGGSTLTAGALYGLSFIIWKDDTGADTYDLVHTTATQDVDATCIEHPQSPF